MKAITNNTVSCLRVCSDVPNGLIWVGNNHYKTPDGSPCGSLNKKGYYQTHIKGRIYLNHRLIFFIEHGYEPEIVDHKDTNPLNNNPTNLRGATKQQNQSNSGRRVDNTSGFKGVHFDKRRCKYYGQVSFKGKIYSTGSFTTPEECDVALRSLREELHGDFTNHGPNYYEDLASAD